MKITEEVIDKSFANLVNDCIIDLYDFSNRSDADDNMRLLALGEIHGMLLLASVLKEKLKETGHEAG